MTLVSTRELMRDAVAAGAGLGAFNVVHLETAEAFVAGAELAGLPVILQISQNCARFHGGLEPIALATLAVARASSARIAVHLDHAEDADLARKAVDLGFSSVMFDCARLPYEANVAATAELVNFAHSRDVYVEAELGAIGGKDGAHAPGVRTDPAEATTFVRETGVDALAVAVGTSHAMTERVASIDLGLLASLHAALSVPLVLHGSSGVPDAEIVRAIWAGITKINVSTHLNGVFTTAVRARLRDDLTMVDSRGYVGAGRLSLATEAGRMIALFASARNVDEAATR
ncbi:class II fructose-bisphosphate aldolase [Pengzhenrongella sicca]|uniref:Class II fructose-bisphosphate aldolase n=1 Tax=Pengzhenrongella sicca TaxID=2819238 RepID=A0A8A4ZB00_9MICO|nr:class II fructose-bisphosphate aldolase [Pengzhenrongella sicca]QTE28591.1 class II fructose-bisphosphate aldolase [Pengzhenrongella sicca]